MNANAVRECELVARAVAMWGSLAAAVVFGIGFATDRALSLHLVASVAEQIGLILLVFAGYMLAWRTRFEVAGSVLALAAVAAYWTWCGTQVYGIPAPIFLVVALPAAFHLSAVAFHRLTGAVERFNRSPLHGADNNAADSEQATT
jgi:hypothetical protein